MTNFDLFSPKALTEIARVLNRTEADLLATSAEVPITARKQFQIDKLAREREITSSKSSAKDRIKIFVEGITPIFESESEFRAYKIENNQPFVIPKADGNEVFTPNNETLFGEGRAAIQSPVEVLFNDNIKTGVAVGSVASNGALDILTETIEATASRTVDDIFQGLIEGGDQGIINARISELQQIIDTSQESKKTAQATKQRFLTMNQGRVTIYSTRQQQSIDAANGQMAQAQREINLLMTNNNVVTKVADKIDDLIKSISDTTREELLLTAVQLDLREQIAIGSRLLTTALANNVIIEEGKLRELQLAILDGANKLKSEVITTQTEIQTQNRDLQTVLQQPQINTQIILDEFSTQFAGTLGSLVDSGTFDSSQALAKVFNPSEEEIVELIIKSSRAQIEATRRLGGLPQ